MEYEPGLRITNILGDIYDGKRSAIRKNLRDTALFRTEMKCDFCNGVLNIFGDIQGVQGIHHQAECTNQAQPVFHNSERNGAAKRRQSLHSARTRAFERDKFFKVLPDPCAEKSG